MLVLISLAVSGCQTLSEKKSDMQLRETLYSYHSTVRWGLLEHAYQFLKPNDEGAAVSVPEDLDTIRVTGYDVVLPPAYLTETTVTQTAKISYVFIDKPVERSLTDIQQWEYDEELKLWFRTNPIPEFK